MQRQWLVDPETGSPQDHDESAKPPTVQTVADDLHDRDDLRDGRWVGRIAQAPCCVEDDRHESRESSPATGDDRLRQEQVTRLYPRIRPEAHTESTALAPRASSAIRGLPLGPRSESAGRHRWTPWLLLSRMELGSAGSTAAFPRMQERHRLRFRPGGRLVLVHSGRLTLDLRELALRQRKRKAPPAARRPSWRR